MKWEKPVETGQYSTDRRYSICAIGYHNGAKGFWEAWRTRSHRDGPHLIATNLDGSDVARGMCEADDDE